VPEIFDKGCGNWNGAGPRLGNAGDVSDKPRGKQMGYHGM